MLLGAIIKRLGVREDRREISLHLLSWVLGVNAMSSAWKLTTHMLREWEEGSARRLRNVIICNGTCEPRI